MTGPAQVAALPSWLLTQTAAHAHRILVERLSAIGARGYDYRVLASLDERGPTSQADLGRSTGIHLSDMVGCLNDLETAHYVERTPDPADRRRNVVTITDRGRERMQRLAAEASLVQADLLAPLSPDERAQLTALLTRLLEHHDARRGVDEPE
ncbi:MarR family winged helix-turn-helix transcriptional regulator [Cellulomonas sp. URHD0024]|uniref:MarR family winged helix-turn-helix transcriptional regulator n=1 Tax=Cellulomonas sp. URHD0024 TaxID=1302620 RepID=UPI000429DF6D|nr:MarR family transcriptional regulator [Cellulomonas sp. URHD0024]